MDNYKVLGIPFGSEITVIKTAYRRLAKQYHPDKTRGDESKTKAFLRIQKSYEELLKGITNKNTSRSGRGNYKVVNVKIKDNGDYLVLVNLNNIKQVELVNTDVTYTVTSDEYYGNLIVTSESMKMVNYKMTLRFIDHEDFYGETTHKVKKPKNFFKKLIDKIWK